MIRRAVGLMAICASVVGAQGPACGRDRWEVKVLRDLDVASVHLEPEPTTVRALHALPEPRERAPVNGRLAMERRVFRVRAMLVDVKPQADGDLHLILADPTDRTKTLIAEIPDSSCATGSRFASDFAEARRALEALDAPKGLEIEIDGVAFWDDEHGQLGVADNGLELHPVLRFAPVMTDMDILMVDVGAVPSDTTPVRVWLNRSSKVYHCPRTAYYGKTRDGEYMPEPAAIRAGARPAGGRPCR